MLISSFPIQINFEQLESLQAYCHRLKGFIILEETYKLNLFIKLLLLFLFSCMQCRHFNFYVSTFSRQKQQKQKQKQKKPEIVMTITFVELGTWYHCQFFILAKKREKTKKSKVLNKKNKSRELRLKYSFSFYSFSPFLVRFPI